MMVDGVLGLPYRLEFGGQRLRIVVGINDHLVRIVAFILTIPL